MRGNSKSSRTGGVLLYIHSKVKYKVVAIESYERNWWSITVKVMDKCYKGLIMLIYHSPNGSDASFVDYLEVACTNSVVSDNVIVMGDFNIDVKVNNYIQNKLIRVMNSAGLKQLVKEATRIVKNSETIIDLVFSNIDIKIEVHHEPKITDHSAIILYWDIKEVTRNTKRIVYRDYKNMKVAEFRKLINDHLNTIEGNGVDVLANSVVNRIIECLDLTAPQKSIVLREKWKGKQWFSEQVKQLIKQRDAAYKVARMSKNGSDWELFRQLRNKTVIVCRKAKRQYLEEKLDKNKKNSKQMWKTLKEMLKGKSVSTEYKEVKIGGEIITNKEEMVDRFNQYFIESVKLKKKDNEEDKFDDIKYTDSEFGVFR